VYLKVAHQSYAYSLFTPTASEALIFEMMMSENDPKLLGLRAVDCSFVDNQKQTCMLGLLHDDDRWPLISFCIEDLESGIIKSHHPNYQKRAVSKYVWQVDITSQELLASRGAAGLQIITTDGDYLRGLIPHKDAPSMWWPVRLYFEPV